MNNDNRFKEYYANEKYKGYYKIRERNYKLHCSKHVVFTNGKRKIFASGNFKEQALKNIFDKIDRLEQ